MTYDHPDWQAFVRAIIARPDDDLPRLVAADWLDENGDGARAEFIQIQCELARLNSAKPPGAAVTQTGKTYPEWQAEMNRLRRRERELHSANWDTWNIGPAGLLLGGVRLDMWRRGFIEVVQTTAADWLRHGDAIMAATPLRDVTLTDWLRYHWPFARPFGSLLTDLVTAYLAERFPGITFELPPMVDPRLAAAPGVTYGWSR